MMLPANRVRFEFFTACLAVIVLGSFPAESHAEGITVVGERSTDNRFDYVWTLANHADKHVTMFRVEQYYGKILRPPKGWVRAQATGESENPASIPRTVEFRVEEPRSAMGRNQTREFHIIISRHWRGTCKRRTVTVGFADGTTLEIPGVLCPANEDWLKRNTSLVGLGALFALFVLGKTIFGKKKSAAESSNHPSNEP